MKEPEKYYYNNVANTLNLLQIIRKHGCKKIIFSSTCATYGEPERVFTKGTYHFPTIIGHEFAGEIVEAEDSALVGKGASVFTLLPCGKCEACRTERYAQCAHYDYYGSRRDGAMAEYLAVKLDNLCFLPKGVTIFCGVIGWASE